MPPHVLLPGIAPGQVRDHHHAQESDTGAAGEWHPTPLDLAAQMPPVTPHTAMERLEILSAIIRASIGAPSATALLTRVLDALRDRYPGLLAAHAVYDPGAAHGSAAPRGSATPHDSATPRGPAAPHGSQAPRDRAAIGAALAIDAASASPGIDWAAFMAAGLAAIDGASGPVLLESGAAAGLLLTVGGAAEGTHVVAFADPADVVALPRVVMASVALEFSYVLDREIAAQQLALREAQFRAIFDASPMAQALHEADDREFATVNDALCALVGYSREELVGRSARAITYPDDIAAIEHAREIAAADPGGQYRVERRMIHASGEIIFTETTLTWIHFSGGHRMLLQQITDITAQRRVERELLEQTETDSLTGLPNRLRIVREISEIGHSGEPFAVLFIDIDSFKSINDARGHDVGDEILIDVAGRLADIGGGHCLVGRFGGDEFAIVCREHGGPGGRSARTGTRPASRLAEGTRHLADRIQRSLAAPVETSAGPIHVTVSIGICDDTIAVSQPLDRLQYADTAAYQAKRMGEDRHVVYDSRLHRQTVEYGRIEALLRTALDEERLVVHYQPIVDVTDGRPVSVEALLRMKDADGTLIFPGEFISVAERSGMIVPIGTWVLAEALREVAALSREIGIPARVSVNVAARQVARPSLVDAVLDSLDAAGLPPKALTLEITESALLEAESDTLRRLYGLRERGVQIALDDFGTGYSSLTYLRQLPVTRVKVDQSFVADMTTDSGSAAIVRAVTSLARDLGLSWVAEGVETEAQWRALKELGPGMAQGYYFARPQPAHLLAQTLGAIGTIGTGKAG